MNGRDNIGKDGLLSIKTMPFIDSPFDVFQPSLTPQPLELSNISVWGQHRNYASRSYQCGSIAMPPLLQIGPSANPPALRQAAANLACCWFDSPCIRMPLASICPCRPTTSALKIQILAYRISIMIHLTPSRRQLKRVRKLSRNNASERTRPSPSASAQRIVASSAFLEAHLI